MDEAKKIDNYTQGLTPERWQKQIICDKEEDESPALRMI